MTEHLRQDEAYLQTESAALLLGNAADGWAIAPLAEADPALRRRALKELFFSLTVPNPSATHIEAAERIVQGADPSAAADLTGGWVLRREYEKFFVEQNPQTTTFAPQVLPCPGSVTLPELGLTFRCTEEREGGILIRPRQQGDEIRLPGGTKSVKKLLIDKKIPVNQRELVPVLEENGVVIALWGVAAAANTDITAITAERERGTGI
jgi:tRNA(Ile)-lysidine synthase